MRFRLPFLFLVLAFLFLNGPAEASVTVKARIDPPDANVGDEVTVTFTVQGGSVSDIQLPPVDGLNVEGSSTSSQFVMNGFNVSQSVSQTFTVVPVRPGDFTIPSFGIHTDDGQIIHTQPMRLHVSGSAGTATSPAAAPALPSQSSGGPVVVPPGANDQTTPQQPANNDGGSGSISVPTDADGRPARVFHLITPRTTDAYVGQSIPLTIQFYIRADSNAQQNSLPTLIGSDFLMNNLSLRPMQDGVGIDNEEYIRNTWITAISAPRPGDFPLEATRDTYWAEGENDNNDPFGALFGRNAKLMHREIGSNKLVIHVHPLPEEGRPANFTGAIGKFQVTGSAEPGTVGVGEPVTLHFTVSGEGNFDYVRAPSLTPDPAWKSYVPTSKVEYEDESHTTGTKTFDQSIIPQKSGVLTLPQGSFSYFDPDAKHYVTVAVPLPSVVVTGTTPSVAATPPAAGEDDSSAVASEKRAPAPEGFAPNELTLGVLKPDLAPLYRHPGFWIAQGALGGVILLGLLGSLVRPRRDPTLAERASREASLRQEEDAMTRAVRAGDAPAFFTAARNAVQLRLAKRWQVPPGALTLHEIGRRDPALAETVAPLFDEADDVIYSGRASSGLDLAEWDQRVRGMLQPARV